MVEHATDPFPYWVLDDFLPEEMAADAYTYFFDGEGKWISRHHLYSRHKETRTEGLSWSVERALRYMESPVLCATLGLLTEKTGLTSDPDRFGGGQHVIYEGGRLGIHADFTHHPTTGMRRALNLLLYLNKGLGDTGGELELWSADMRRCVQRITPLFNRAVIFETSVTSYHGHPDPLPWGPRQSLACYYYVPDRKPEYDPRSSLYGQPRIDMLKTTDYRPRPWEYGLRLRRRLRIMVKGR